MRCTLAEMYMPQYNSIFEWLPLVKLLSATLLLVILPILLYYVIQSDYPHVAWIFGYLKSCIIGPSKAVKVPRASLVIVADDLGVNFWRDQGIFEGIRRGAITAASLLVNGPTAAEAFAIALHLGLLPSLHVNLTEGIPVRPETSRVPGLFDGKASFFETAVELRENACCCIVIESRELRNTELRAAPPLPPDPPADSDCCGEGCNPCVWDRYDDARAVYERNLALWELEHGTEDSQESTEGPCPAWMVDALQAYTNRTSPSDLPQLSIAPWVGCGSSRCQAVAPSSYPGGSGLPGIPSDLQLQQSAVPCGSCTRCQWREIVYREIVAQIDQFVHYRAGAIQACQCEPLCGRLREALSSAGTIRDHLCSSCAPRHLDGHHHVHVVPLAVAPFAAALLTSFARSIRLPVDAVFDSEASPGSGADNIGYPAELMMRDGKWAGPAFLTQITRWAVEAYQSYRFVVTMSDRFVGLTLMGVGADESQGLRQWQYSLELCLRCIPSCRQASEDNYEVLSEPSHIVIEAMTHPGGIFVQKHLEDSSVRDYPQLSTDAFSTSAARHAELRFLCSKSFSRLLSRMEIERSSLGSRL